MHRDNVDDAVTYTPDDLVLFRESPFAAWMERLTLDNPDHGILPDAGAPEPREHMESVDDIVATLRAEGEWLLRAFSSVHVSVEQSNFQRSR